MLTKYMGQVSDSIQLITLCMAPKLKLGFSQADICVFMSLSLFIAELWQKRKYLFRPSRPENMVKTSSSSSKSTMVEICLTDHNFVFLFRIGSVSNQIFSNFNQNKVSMFSQSIIELSNAENLRWKYHFFLYQVVADKS